MIKQKQFQLKVDTLQKSQTARTKTAFLLFEPAADIQLSKDPVVFLSSLFSPSLHSLVIDEGGGVCWIYFFFRKPPDVSHTQLVQTLDPPSPTTLGFTSTETIKAYKERGSWGVRNYISNTYSLHCHHQNDSALRWAVVWAILMFSLIVWAKSQDCP